MLLLQKMTMPTQFSNFLPATAIVTTCHVPVFQLRMATHVEYCIARKHLSVGGLDLLLTSKKVTSSGCWSRKLQARVTKKQCIEVFWSTCFIWLAPYFWGNYSPWLHMLDFVGWMQYLSFTTKGKVVFPTNIPPARCFFCIFKKIFYITYTYIHYTYIYIYLHLYIYPKQMRYPPKKAPFDDFAWKKICSACGHIMASLEVPERCLCSRRGRASGGAFARVVGPVDTVDTDTPGRNQGKGNAFFWVVHRGVLGI